MAAPTSAPCQGPNEVAALVLPVGLADARSSRPAASVIESGAMMERVGNVWRVRAGKAEEYARRHAEIWPELDALLRGAGVRSYSIYLWGEIVFSHMDVEDYDRLVQAFNGDPVAQRWEREMQELIEYPDADPATGWPERLRTVWSLSVARPADGGCSAAS